VDIIAGLRLQVSGGELANDKVRAKISMPTGILSANLMRSGNASNPDHYSHAGVVYFHWISMDIGVDILAFSKVLSLSLSLRSIVNSCFVNVIITPQNQANPFNIAIQAFDVWPIMATRFPDGPMLVAQVERLMICLVSPTT